MLIIHMYSTRNTPQCNVIQTMPPVQYSVTHLNGVTKKDQIKHEMRKYDHFKHSVKMRTIRNNHYENENEKDI